METIFGYFFFFFFGSKLYFLVLNLVVVVMVADSNGSVCNLEYIVLCFFLLLLAYLTKFSGVLIITDGPFPSVIITEW